MCSNARTIRQDRLELQLLAALEERLLNSKIIDYTLQRFHEELQRRLAVVQRQATGMDESRRERQQLQAKAGRLADAIAETGHSPAILSKLAAVEAQIAEGLRIWGKGSLREQNAKVQEVMELCGLEYLPALKRRRFQFSGGQCQRISIARALVLEPKLLICDEPVSSLDVSVQAQVLNLLLDMRERYGLTMLFISHDLGVVHHLTDRVIVMYLGKICEVGTPEQLYENPRHHYTQMLIDAIPDPDPNAVFPSIPLGDMPSPIAPPSGCRFRTRCPRAEQRCADEEPVIRETTSGHYVACHFPASTRTAQSAGTPEVSTAPSA